MLTEMIIESHENHPVITERLTDTMAWYIGDFFQEEGVVIDVNTLKIGRVRPILFPEGTEIITANESLSITIGNNTLKVLL